MSDVNRHIDGAERCVICGRDIPEGSQVCIICGKTKARDMVEVVRCKDCAECNCFHVQKQIGREPELVIFCELFEREIDEYDYCSYGVKRGE